ncbi:MAG: grasp-with-spasm system SPASM domain peptide maturase [Crocinitomicaceae bacterium]|nr:grasp-with-spasm system SPASM domain peptide maturase [Crocinitomicaceae bacterium]
MTNQVTVLASNCFSVKGYNKHLLIDFQNDEWYHVDFHISKNENFDVDSISREDFEYLISRQILIQIPKSLRSQFPSISTEFQTPSIIESAIIDRNLDSNYSLEKAFDWMDSLIVKFCQVRYFDQPKIEELNLILNLIESSHIESIEFLVPFSEELVHSFESFVMENPKINNIVFHSANELKFEIDLPNKKRIFIKEKIHSSNNCGNIHPNYFSHTKKHILKSMNFNSCLYKKIGVDIQGNIKNCPSISTSIGHIESLELINNVQLETEYWNIKKDDIEICNGCEFRYICNDCRVQVKHKKGRPLTCNYNPYTNLWKGQKGYKEPILK